ncbi:MAG TPA: recombination mediator RecR [Chitinispirillaceae bacterium]|nr:recombination mediator RecR [Chitinispirillaceae bacterium]
MIEPLEELVKSFCRLPAIGQKSAWRLVLYLMERPEAEAYELADSIRNAREKLTTCKRCFNYSENEICPVCSNPSRDQGCICVVEKPVDAFAIEKSGRFRGVYHILGGVLSPLSGITADKIRIGELKNRVITEKPQELIIGFGGSAEAETTALYLARLFRNDNVRITRFARGLPAGLDLEYVDQITLTQALNERTDIIYGE